MFRASVFVFECFVFETTSVSDGVTKVYQSARDGSSNLIDLKKPLKTEQTKTALETYTRL